MSAAEDFPDVDPDDPSFPECVAQPAGVADVVAVYQGGYGVPLRVPRNVDIQERDILWCQSLICALGEGVIDTKQMERILHIFNQRRPE